MAKLQRRHVDIDSNGIGCCNGDVALHFHPHDPSFNRTNALYLAHASDVAYHRAPAAAAMERLGLKTIAFRNRVTRVRGFLGVCDTHAVLAFRGSEPVTLASWVTDVVVRLGSAGNMKAGCIWVSVPCSSGHGARWRRFFGRRRISRCL